jgi:hypothetical protein
MPRMSKEETRMWKERLEHVNWVWKEKGYTGEGERSIKKYMEAYVGEYPELQGWGNLRLQVVNGVFSSVNAMISQLSARNPHVMVRPSHRTDIRRARGARINELVLNYFQYELRLKRQWDKALRDALIIPGGGFIQHGYTPSVEKFDDQGKEIEIYSPARADLPWIRRVPIWDVRVDPTAETWYPDEDAQWVMFRSFLTMEQIRKNPGLIEREDLRPTTTFDRRVAKNERDPTKQNPGPEDLKCVEVWTCYDKTERKWFSLATGCAKPIREPDDWPIPWEDLPFDWLAFNTTPNEPDAVSFTSQIWPQVTERMKLRTLMAELVKRTRRLVVYNPDALADGGDSRLEAGDNLAEFFATREGADPSTVVKEVNIGQFPQELLLYDALIAQDIRETIQQSLMDRAQRINVETATEAQGVRIGSATGQGRNQERFEDFLADIMRHFHIALRSEGIVTEDLLIAIAGANDAQVLFDLKDYLIPEAPGFIKIGPSDLHGEFSYRVRVGSTLPEDHDREIARLLMIKQATAGDPSVNQRALNELIIEESGHDTSRLMVTPQVEIDAEKRRTAAEAMGKGGNSGNSGGNLTNTVRNLDPGLRGAT